MNLIKSQQIQINQINPSLPENLFEKDPHFPKESEVNYNPFQTVGESNDGIPSGRFSNLHSRPVLIFYAPTIFGHLRKLIGLGNIKLKKLFCLREGMNTFSYNNSGNEPDVVKFSYDHKYYLQAITNPKKLKLLVSILPHIYNHRMNNKQSFFCPIYGIISVYHNTTYFPFILCKNYHSSQIRTFTFDITAQNAQKLDPVSNSSSLLGFIGQQNNLCEHTTYTYKDFKQIYHSLQFPHQLMKDQIVRVIQNDLDLLSILNLKVFSFDMHITVRLLQPKLVRGIPVDMMHDIDDINDLQAYNFKGEASINPNSEEDEEEEEKDLGTEGINSEEEEEKKDSVNSNENNLYIPMNMLNPTPNRIAIKKISHMEKIGIQVQIQKPSKLTNYYIFAKNDYDAFEDFDKGGLIHLQRPTESFGTGSFFSKLSVKDSAYPMKSVIVQKYQNQNPFYVISFPPSNYYKRKNNTYYKIEELNRHDNEIENIRASVNRNINNPNFMITFLKKSPKKKKEGYYKKNIMHQILLNFNGEGGIYKRKIFFQFSGYLESTGDDQEHFPPLLQKDMIEPQTLIKRINKIL